MQNWKIIALVVGGVAVLAGGTLAVRQAGLGGLCHHNHGAQAAAAGGAPVAAAGFLNDRCPIMGSPINAQTVPASLTRTTDGGKVAFCCGGCPEQWDAMDAAARQGALLNVVAEPSNHEACCGGHDHDAHAGHGHGEVAHAGHAECPLMGQADCPMTAGTCDMADAAACGTADAATCDAHAAASCH